MKAVVIGTTFVDIKGYPLGSFIPTGRNAGRVEQFPGGVGRNIAESMNSLGADTTFVSLVDPTGISTDIVKHLDEIGVNTEYVVPTCDGLGTWLAIFDEAGDVCASISKRADLLPICDILGEHGTEIFRDADCILPEIDMEEPVIQKIFELAETYKTPVYSVISNMTIARERLEYIKKSRCFVCNCLEAGILFEKDTEELTPAEMLQLLKSEIRRLGIESMVVTMDSRGCVYASLDGQEGICPAEKVTVVDTTGAGDSFFAGLSFALAGGADFQSACRLATKVSAQVITSKLNVITKDCLE